MRKLWIGLLVLAVLMFAAVLIVPSFFDWNAHKKRIAAAVLEATGRELTIRGDVDVTILPSPGLRVSDVRFANVYGAAAPDMLRLDEARVSIALGPLFEGRLAAVVTLVKPIINLETLKDGRTSWDLHTRPSGAGAVAAGKPPARDEKPVAHSPLAGLPFDVELRNFRIVGGTVSYYDARTGFFERIDRLKSNVSFDSLTGPFRIQGEGQLHGVSAGIELSTGRVTPGAPLPLLLTLRSPRGGAEIRFQGKLSEPSADGVLRGEISADAANPGALFADMTRETAPAALSHGLGLTARVEASRSKVDVSALQFSLGKARAAGVASATFGQVPDVKIKLNSTNLDLDDILSGTGAKPGPASVDTTAQHASARLPASASSGKSILPANLNASIQANADVIQFRNALVRDFALLGSLHKGRFTLLTAQATMPGNSKVEAKGTVTSQKDDMALDIDLQARSDNLREVLQWLGADVAAVPADKLRRFKASAKVTGHPHDLSIRKLLVTLDASEIAGGVNLALRERPAFGLRLVADRFNLDGYLPGRGARLAAKQAAGKDAGGAKPSKQSAKPDKGDPITRLLQALNRFDANIDAQVKQLMLAKTPMQDVRIDLTVVNGGVELRKATLKDFAGIQASLKGGLSQTGSSPAIRLDYDFRMLDRSRFLRFLGNPGLLRTHLTERLDMAGRVSGTTDKISLKSRFGLLDGTVDVEGAIVQPVLAPEADLAVKAAFPELVQLVRIVAPGYKPAAGKLGAVDVAFKMAGRPRHFKLSDASGSFGPVRAKGAAELRFGGERPQFVVSASTSEVLLDLFLPTERAAWGEPAGSYRVVPVAAGAPSRPSRWSDEPIDLSILSQFDASVALDLAAVTRDPYRFRNMKVRAAVAGGKLEITDWAADYSSGALKGTVFLGPEKDTVKTAFQVEAKNIDLADIAPVLRNYQLRLGPVRFGARMSGPLTLNLTLRGAGKSQKAIVAGLAGTGHVTGKVQTKLSEETRQASALTGLAGQLLGDKVKDLQRYTGVAKAPARLAAAFDGSSTLNGDFEIEKGIIRTDNLVLLGGGGRALTSGRAKLPAWRLATQTEVTLLSEKEAFLTVEMAGQLNDPYVSKLGGAMYRPEPAAAPAGPQPAPKAGADAKPKRSEPAELRKFKPEDLFKGFKEYKGLLEGMGR